jgi:hypothetical protein
MLVFRKTASVFKVEAWKSKDLTNEHKPKQKLTVNHIHKAEQCPNLINAFNVCDQLTTNSIQIFNFRSKYKIVTAMCNDFSYFLLSFLLAVSQRIITLANTKISVTWKVVYRARSVPENVE